MDPDQTATSSLIRVHTVCLYAKIDLKSLQEYSADDICRQLSSALSSACDFKSFLANSVGPDQTAPSSLIRPHAVCLYAKIGLKSLQEYSADDIFRCRFSWHFKD